MTRSIRDSKFPHALLFVGPCGVGKGLVAMELAKLLNCERHGTDPCYECSTCKRIDSFNHPDVRWIENTNGSIKIEQIRWLLSQVNLRPYESRVKVFIVKDADLMTEEAQNALLKTLEEPPARTYLILISSNPGSLLPTISSRCQVLRFRPLNFQRIKDELLRRYNLKPDKAHFLAHLSGGRLGKAIRLMEEDILAKKNRVIDNMLSTLRSDELVKWEDESKQELQGRLEILIDWYRDLLVLREGNFESLINMDRKEDLIKQKDKYSHEELIDIIEQLIQLSDLIMGNVNPKIVLDVMVRKIKKVTGRGRDV